MRLLGFLIGLAALGALWFNARVFKISFPIISLLLLGFCPALIIWGDSLRAWGWGVFWILLTLGLVWRAVESPTVLNVAFAALAAIGSVQSSYYNAVLLFAICAGGAAVAARQRAWKNAVAVAGIGLAAAISLTPYLGIFRRGAAEYIILKQPFGARRFLEKLNEAIQIPGTAMIAVWVLLLALGTGAAIYCQARPAALKATARQRDMLLFSVTTLITGVAGYFLFLKNLQFFTHPWYYAALLAVAAVTLDVMLSVANNQEQGRVGRLVFAAGVSAMAFLPVWRMAHVRLTNVDTLANTLAQRAAAGDLIVVNPWFCGVSFDHYYQGAAAWTGLPDVKDYKVHRYDTLKEMMMMREPAEAIRGVCDKMEATLKSGKRLWLVTGPIGSTDTGSPPRLLPAPTGPSGWYFIYYGVGWSKLAGGFIGSHAQNLHGVELAADGPVSPYEDLKLLVVEGWREN